MTKFQKVKDWSKRNKHLIIGGSLAVAGAVLGVIIYRSVEVTVEEQSKNAEALMRWLIENDPNFDPETKIVLV